MVYCILCYSRCYWVQLVSCSPCSIVLATLYPWLFCPSATSNYSDDCPAFWIEASQLSRWHFDNDFFSFSSDNPCSSPRSSYEFRTIHWYLLYSVNRVS